MAPDEEGTTPERAFWLLSDETRVAILRAVWAAEEPLPFSAIRERVGNPDSGKFNYHLDKLRGHFLSKGESGYELTQAGREVVRAVLAGTITERPAMDPVAVDGDCPTCGATLVARYDEYGIVDCPECGETVMWNEFPPAGLADRSPRAFAAAFDEWTRARFHLATEGVCPSCAAEMATEIRDEEGAVSTLHRCRNCRYEARVPLFGHVIDHPAVVSFFHERDVDVAALPYWELRTLAREFDERVTSGDPWTATVAIEDGNERLELTLDERLAVTDVDWSGR